jgi:hypothetical protein
VVSHFQAVKGNIALGLHYGLTNTAPALPHPNHPYLDRVYASANRIGRWLGTTIAGLT